MKPTDPVIESMLSGCILMRSRLLSRMVTAIYDEELRPYGIGSAQFVLLLIIFKIEPATRSEIGRFHHQERSTLTRNLKVVLAEGWAEEVQDGADGRRRPIVLTKAGRDLLHKAETAWKVGQTRAKALLGKEGACAVSDIANRIIQKQKAV